MLKVDSVEFILNDTTSYKINGYQIESFPLIGGTKANLITTQVFNQHGNTFKEAYMEAQDEELVFVIPTLNKNRYEVEAARKDLAAICNPLNGSMTMKVTLNSGSVYNRTIVFTYAPSFLVGADNRNPQWQKVQLQYEASNPFWYSEEEIVESFQAVTPEFIFPFTMTGEVTKTYSDFTGKIVGSTVENPNLFRYRSATTLGVVSDFVTEATQANHVDKIKTLDGQVSSYSTSTSGNIAQMMWSFNVIEILERTWGTAIWNGATALADKIAAAKTLITRIRYSYNGYGVAPTGNKITLARWDSSANSWYGNWAYTNSTITEHLITSATPSNNIDANGFTHLVAYTDASTGTAVTLNTDYINIELFHTLPFEADPVIFGAIQPNSIATNYGHVEAPVLIRIYGACTNPRIENVTTGEYIKFNNLTMIASDVLEINTAFGEKYVRLNETTNVFNKLDYSSTFFNLLVGDNEISFSDDTGTPAAAIHFYYKNLFITI